MERINSDTMAPVNQGTVKETNNLFPVFLKLEKLHLLIVGGGAVGAEKLNAVVYNSPSTMITLVAISISEGVKLFAEKHNTIQLIERPYQSQDMDDADLVIVAVGDKNVSLAIQKDAKSKGKLVNVADTPELCDFYLGSVVKKGNLKIAISTNGKSPTIAKRLKELFSEALPDQVDDLLDNMQTIRLKLNGNLSAKINKLNDITRILATQNGTSGLIAAPIAARLAGRLPLKTMFICVGAMVIIWSISLLVKMLFVQ